MRGDTRPQANQRAHPDRDLAKGDHESDGLGDAQEMNEKSRDRARVRGADQLGLDRDRTGPLEEIRIGELLQSRVEERRAEKETQGHEGPLAECPRANGRVEREATLGTAGPRVGITGRHVSIVPQDFDGRNSAAALVLVILYQPQWSVSSATIVSFLLAKIQDLPRASSTGSSHSWFRRSGAIHRFRAARRDGGHRGRRRREPRSRERRRALCPRGGRRYRRRLRGLRSRRRRTAIDSSASRFCAHDASPSIAPSMPSRAAGVPTSSSVASPRFCAR